MNHDTFLEILNVPSPSGREEKMKAFIAQYLKKIGIVPIDAGYAGLYWEIGEGESLALVSAHIDQVSYTVERIDKEGYIYFQMPGIDARIAPGQEVSVWGKKELTGVVGMVPPHYLSQEERTRPVPRKKLFIDTGLAAEQVHQNVHIGDSCTWRYRSSRMLGTMLTGAGIDNRVSLYLSLLLTERLSSKSLPGRVRFIASTQEEGMMFGAAAATRLAFQSTEDVSFALIMDATFGLSHGVEDSAFPLGEGYTLGVGPILSKSHLHVMKEVSESLNLSYSLEPLTRSTGTEADIISLVGEGMPVILLSIPIRNMHSPVEVVDLNDVELSLKLLDTAFVEEKLWEA